MMRGVGMSGVRTFAAPNDLEANLGAGLSDVLILSESTDSYIFELTKRVRRTVVGRNPFTVILLLVSPDNQASIGAALKSGADSALVKPVTSGQLMDRIAQLAFSRAPFIATTDYIGPERRAGDRGSDIPLIQAINTLRYKLERKNIPPEALEKAIATTSAQLWHGQLKSYSLKLQWSCKTILEHYRAQHPPSEMKVSLADLITLLEEAATTAQRISQQDMLKTCQELVKKIEGLASDTAGLDDNKLKIIASILAAFEQARQRLTVQA
jgi:hypothetical protein